MSDIFHRSLIPSPYRLPERALSYVQYVIINWLDIEVDETAPDCGFYTWAARRSTALASAPQN
jgi:hypothetical protein